MRVFVTGATGFIGSAIVRELIGMGHQVLGLARSDAAAKFLIASAAQVHRGDLEDLESLRSRASRFHEVADEGVPFKEIAGVIGRHRNVSVVAKSAEEAADHFGWFTHFAAIDNPASSKRTREVLGWQPKEPGLIPDLDRSHYFHTKDRSAA
jgi:nucleoside-diphosphate-sugar epimerase